MEEYETDPIPAKNNWPRIIDFIQAIVGVFTIGPQHTQAGVDNNIIQEVNMVFDLIIFL